MMENGHHHYTNKLELTYDPWSIHHGNGRSTLRRPSKHWCPVNNHPRRRKSTTSVISSSPKVYFSSALSSLPVLLLALLLLCGPAGAAFVHFENCLTPTVQNSQDPRFLQFEPFSVWATFNRKDAAHSLNITTYGNVTGVANDESYPSWDDGSWLDPNKTLGKIVDLSPTNNKYSTLFATFNVLSYTQYEARPSRFCNSTVGVPCPLIPAFNVSRSNITSLPGFSVAHDMESTYAFTSISTTLRVTSGDESNADLACVSAIVTPDLGCSLRSILTYLPLVVLLSVGFATVFAGIFSPWGSLDPFHWTSNWGRDEDLIRLVTPGFTDCLQYIQFIVLSGSLTLNYPGFFRPVVSSVGWSALMFNESFVTRGNGRQSVQDGIYVVDTVGKYGLDQMSQLIGMTSVRDIWAGMMIWLLVIIAAVIAFIQLGFVLRWAYHLVANVTQEDLRKKDWPFTAGNIIRIVFNFFILPLISLSMFQLVVATEGPTVGVIFAAFVLVAVVGFASWLTYLVATIRPRSFLFDDLPTVLTYGPLYNTYTDEAASFAIIQIFINVLRGIAIGAVQPSGIAQLVLLAIGEIILGLTLNAIRPYPAPTSMNVYHTCFAILRAITIFLSVTFVPSLGVAEAPRGWIGYIILLLHAIGLVFGFFLNALQTIVEVAARLAGAGGHGDGATRGGLSKVFGMRQLQRRVSRRDNTSHNSMASGAAMLSPEVEQKSLHLDHGRARSTSASSAILLQRNGGSDGRSSVQGSGSGANFYHRTSHSGHYTPNTPEAGSTFSKTASGHRSSGPPAAIIGLKQVDASDPYYRPPRQRRNTVDLISPIARSRGSMTSGDMIQDVPNDPDIGSEEDAGVGPSISGRVTPIQTHTMGGKDDYDDLTHEINGQKSDYYASREVDYYYGVRGPALSSGTRRLKTGPADPTGPVSSATGWFRNLFGGKTKEKGKGFEVVRSARAPPQRLVPTLDGTAVDPEPYRDSPTDSQYVSQRVSDPPTHNGGDLGDTCVCVEPYSDSAADDDHRTQGPRLSSVAPSLPAIDAGGDIELPSRLNSRASRVSEGAYDSPSRPPYVPRRSSKRKSQQAADFPAARLSTVTASPPASPQKARSPGHKHLTSSTSSRLPFGVRNSLSKSSHYSTGADSTASSFGVMDDEENQVPSFSHARHSSSVLGAHAPDIKGDRPSSMGYVPQHRASDNIRRVDSGSPEFEGSTAEFVGNPVQHVGGY
jgi:Transient receptor potential (TRP) ion channel/ML-like domain